MMDEKARVKMMPALGFLGRVLYYDNGAVEVTAPTSATTESMW